MTLWENITYKIKYAQSKLFVLIGINVAIYLAINIPAVLEQLFVTGLGKSYILALSEEYLTMPSALDKLATRFWTPFTYMFMHASILHILFNMLWLYWMGQIFEDFLGKKRTVGLYIMGGLAGALFVLLAYNLVPALKVLNGITLIGASASVMAVVVATATLLPNYTMHLMFFGPVKLKWIALAYIVIDFLGITGFNAGGNIAHLGGALIGFIYIKRLQNGGDMIGKVNDLFSPRPKMRVVSRNADKVAAAYPPQEEIDRILDKISQSGYDNLTRQEKETLSRASSDER